MKFKTIIGNVTLISERKSHIILHHPIMENFLVSLKEILENPEEIRYSNYSDEVLLFYRFFDKIEGGKYIVAVINQTDKEVKTAYLTHRIKIGRKYKQSL